MKNKHIIYVLAIAAAVASCSKEMNESKGISVMNPNPPERRVEFLSFKASLENKYQTKTAIDLDITHKVIWERDDEVLIEDADGHSAIYKAISGGRDTTTLVRVSGDTLVTESRYKAWYPVSFRTEGLPPIVYYDDPSTQHGAPMYAEGMAKLDFASSCGIVRFSYNPASSSIVKKIVFSAGESLSPRDSVVMDFTTNYPNGRTLYPTTRNEFPLCMLPGTYSSLRAKMYNGKEVIADVTLEYSFEVAPGKIIDIDLNNPEGRVANLSKLGTANCYPVTHAGEFSFAATRGCNPSPIEGIESVEILWETDNSTTAMTASTLENLKYENGRVSFVIPEEYTPCNVLLGAKNAAGDILWSWHIWVCDGPLGNLRFGSEKDPVMLMDRCLGTLSAFTAKATGAKFATMLYQWGRKDPFPACTVNGTSGLRPQSELRGIQRAAEAGPVSQETAAAHPYVFYTGTNDWLSEPSDTLWAADHKTINDPCPVGYRLPPMSVYSNQEGDFYQGWAAGCYANSGGIYGGKNKFNNDMFGFPLTNRYDGASHELKSADATSHYAWTTAFSESDQPLGMRLWWANKAVTLVTDVDFKKSDAISVRCMLIQQ